MMAIVAITVLLGTAALFLNVSLMSRRISLHRAGKVRARWAALSGANYALDRLNQGMSPAMLPGVTEGLLEGAEVVLEPERGVEGEWTVVSRAKSGTAREKLVLRLGRSSFSRFPLAFRRGCSIRASGVSLEIPGPL